MSRARHKMEHEREHKEAGGPLPYNAQGSEAEKEAKERKDGGRLKRKSGGSVEGESTHARMDRPRRRRGGSVGGSNSDKSPLTTAAKVTAAKGHTDTMSGEAGDGTELEPD